MLVSIGIPVYNGEEHIALSILSVLNQSFKDFELLIADDGSTDNTYNVVNSFDDPRVHFISDKINKGISYRLNQLIDRAKGRYFVRMDADDIMFPNRLEEQIKFMESHPDTDLLATPAIVIDNNNLIIGRRGQKSPPESIEELFKRSPFIHPSVIGKLQWFKTYKYSEELSGVEDFDLWIRSFSRSVFRMYDHPLLFYRDPLCYRLESYRFRMRQIRRMYKKNSYLLPSASFYYRALVISLLKECISVLFHYCKLDSALLSNRNQLLDDDEIKLYSTCLSGIVLK